MLVETCQCVLSELSIVWCHVGDGCSRKQNAEYAIAVEEITEMQMLDDLKEVGDE